jgi:hypothetical protein
MEINKETINEILNDSKRLSDMEKMADAFYEAIEYDGSCEFGSIGLDCKRPFGNSNVLRDIAEIIEMNDSILYEDSEEGGDVKRYLSQLYYDLPDFLKYKWSQYRAAKFL